ncbi:MAG: ribosome assembly factor SBDS [Candidatus Micrarchaeota archaeon]|nr:ribosome assembly factor SBDS [Candidatus Micrarchaeota archaeon]
MASLERSITAHIDIGGERFEILVDPDLAQAYRRGQKKELNNVLTVEEVFKNFRKGERHTSSALQKAFGTTDVWQIADRILKNGEIQLTTEQKRKMLEEKKRQIIAMLLREAIDPRTGAPHTQLRLEQALEQSRVHIDAFADAASQLDKVIAALRPIIPLKFERVKVAAKIPAQFAQRIYGMLKGYGIQKEEWASDGSLIVVIEMPAGLQGEFYDRLNKATAGQAETRLIK